MRLELLEALLDLRRKGRAAALVTSIPDGAQALIEGERMEGALALDPETLASVRAAVADDRSGTIEGATGTYFVEVWNPPLRLFVVGAVHIAQALAPMAALAGYDVTVIDPRSAFASEPRFTGVDLVAEWPDEALEACRPDRRSAIVTLTHDPKIDDPALQAALRSEAFYIGALGSRRTHARRLDRLREAGFGDADLARIHGPVGLDIGAISPGEIAVSALAEITTVLRADRLKRKAVP